MSNNITTNKQKIELLESAFGKSKLANAGTNISVECPVCKNNAKTGKGKKKLSIDLGKGIYHCWVCESKGRNIGRFVKHNTNASKKIVSDIYTIFNFSMNLNDVQEIEKIMMPEGFELLVTSKRYGVKKSINYLKERGLCYDDLLKYKIGVSTESSFYNRIIFPSFDEDLKLNFFLSRVINDSQKIKYRNCVAKKSDVIFNEYLIDWKKPVVLVEGVFDAIKAGKNAIPVLGSWIDMKHSVFRRVVMEESDVVLAFDPDAKQKTLEIASMLSEFGNSVKITQHTETDFGAMTKEEANYWIENAKPYEQTDRMTYLIKTICSGSMF